jgi:hypothetical protein
MNFDYKIVFVVIYVILIVLKLFVLILVSKKRSEEIFKNSMPNTKMQMECVFTANMIILINLLYVTDPQIFTILSTIDGAMIHYAIYFCIMFR